MGLFRKNKKEENTVNNTQEVKLEESKPEAEANVEIIDLDKNEEKKSNSLSTINKKENRLIFGIIFLLIIFVFFLPTITGFLNRKSIFTYSKTVDDIINTHTVDGMLEIGSDDGSITAKNIKFYNPTKKSGNEIQLVYLPENSVKNVLGLNIYIEFYNSNKKIIYRTPFNTEFALERKVQGTLNYTLDSSLYKEAIYAKVSVIKEDEFKKAGSSLVCTNTTEQNGYKLNQTITYNFSDKGLVSYQVNKVAEKLNSNDETTIDKELFEEEANQIESTNTKDLTYDEDKINYTIDLTTLEIGKSKYSILYNKGSVERQIKLHEESKNWSCK